MLIRFSYDAEESGIWHISDDLTEEQLRDLAYAWAADNVTGYYEILNDDTL